jgi:hypothetical protein
MIKASKEGVTMGWEFQYQGTKTPLQILKQDYPSFDFVATNRKGNVIYAALRKDDKPEIVFAGIFLLQTRDGMLGVKAMGEDSWPYYYGASQRVLDALTEPATDYAREWRDKCRQELAKPKIKLEAGMTVKFDPPLAFRDGLERDTLKVEDPKRRTFRDDDGYILFKIDAGTLKDAISEGRMTVA